MMSWDLSTDAGELLAYEHVEYAAGPEGRAQHDPAWMFPRYATDHHRVVPVVVVTHGANDGAGGSGINKGNQLALVRDEQGIEPEQLARRPHLVADRNGGLLDLNAYYRPLRDLAQGRRKSATCGVPHTAYGRCVPTPVARDG